MDEILNAILFIVFGIPCIAVIIAFFVQAGAWFYRGARDISEELYWELSDDEVGRNDYQERRQARQRETERVRRKNSVEWDMRDPGDFDGSG